MTLHWLPTFICWNKKKIAVWVLKQNYTGNASPSNKKKTIFILLNTFLSSYPKFLRRNLSVTWFIFCQLLFNIVFYIFSLFIVYICFILLFRETPQGRPLVFLSYLAEVRKHSNSCKSTIYSRRLRTFQQRSLGSTFLQMYLRKVHLIWQGGNEDIETRSLKS